MLHSKPFKRHVCEKSITTTEVYAHLIPEAVRYESARVFPEEGFGKNVGLLLDRPFSVEAGEEGM